jgi:hypothetical protein
MSHPDSAFSQWYSAPDGIEGDPCHHALTRIGVGPTSRRRVWRIAVDQCYRCSRIVRSARDLTWRQYDWIRRWNNRTAEPTP